MAQMKDTFLYTKKHVLFCGYVDIDNTDETLKEEFAYARKNFCGNVFFDVEKLNQFNPKPNSLLFVCDRNVREILTKINSANYSKICIIQDLSNISKEFPQDCQLVSLGQIPINVNGVGVYFRKLFDSNKDYFSDITNEHQFQSLTLGNQRKRAHRKGIYLAKVEPNDKDEIQFKLLRCSTNLDGPTDNFRATDTEIVERLNNIRQSFFKDGAELNHVLAQAYYNGVNENGKQKKAKIAEHSDKTKDMPQNGLMSFCTFYKDFVNDQFTSLSDAEKSGFDYRYKSKDGPSILTRLRFRLKKQAAKEYPNLEEIFDIVLYPNSAFFMPLRTNRLYTHEIIPSGLQNHKVPTRMGYVVRCSNTNAIYKDNQTYIVKDDNYIKLDAPTKQGVKELKKLYFIENTTIDRVSYEHFYFSMNQGDYMKPLV